MKVRIFVALLASGALAGCGAETVGAAATSAAIKKQELREGQRTLEHAQERIGQAIELQQQRADRSAEAH